MIRRLIILLLIVGCVFAQKDYLVLKNGDKHWIRYVATADDGTVRVQIYESNNSITSTSFNLDEIYSLTLEDGSIAIEPPVDFELPKGKVKRYWEEGYTGGLLIMAGALLLHTYPDDPFCISNECSSMDDYKEYADKKQLQWRAGIILIALGGFFVVLGI